MATKQLCSYTPVSISKPLRYTLGQEVIKYLSTVAARIPKNVPSQSTHWLSTNCIHHLDSNYIHDRTKIGPMRSNKFTRKN